MACTTVIVGKKATIDGSTMAGRNVDTFGPYCPQRAIVVPANDHQSGNYVSNMMVLLVHIQNMLTVIN